MSKADKIFEIWKAMIVGLAVICAVLIVTLIHNKNVTKSNIEYFVNEVQ